MDEYQTSSIIYWYEELEERLIEFLKFLPFTLENLNVSSPRLAGVVTETCHILDSLFREVSNPKETIKGEIKKKAGLVVTDYAELYANRLNLPATKSLIFVSPPRYLIPFEKWESLTMGGEYEPLPWWRAYNKLKHSRIKNMKEATLANAVNSLCGLHQVIARLPKLIRATLRHGWLQLGDYDPQCLIERLEGRLDLIKDTFLGTVLSNEDTFLVESKLFAVPIGIDPFPDDIADLLPIHYRGHSERFTRFTGRW